MRGTWLIFAAGMAASAWAFATAPGTASEPEGPVPARATNTPQAFLDFCARVPEECIRKSQPAHFRVSPELWLAAGRINQQVNAQVRAADDIALYGEPEYWVIAGKAGDCEDYVLLKRKLLRQAGFPEGSLLITIVRDEKNEGHAVLTLVTPEGEFILDNRRDAMLPPAATGYRYLKRQSGLDPMRWVSLTAENADSVASAEN